MNIVIENNVPLPAPRHSGLTAALRKLTIGQSVLIPNRAMRGINPSVFHVHKKTGHDFTCRTEGTGVRVWRTEPKNRTSTAIPVPTESAK